MALGKITAARTVVAGDRAETSFQVWFQTPMICPIIYYMRYTSYSVLGSTCILCCCLFKEQLGKTTAARTAAAGDRAETSFQSWAQSLRSISMSLSTSVRHHRLYSRCAWWCGSRWETMLYVCTYIFLNLFINIYMYIYIYVYIFKHDTQSPYLTWARPTLS